MIFVFIIVFCALVALGFGGASARSDFNGLTIPNLYVGAVGASFVPAFLILTFLAPDVSVFSSWANHLIAGGVTLGVTYLLFHFKLIGGGDSKLLSVYALWTGLSGLMPLLFVMGVVGGLLALGTILLNKHKPVKSPVEGGWIDQSQKGAQSVPYGIAIFLGAVYAFWQVGYIHPETLTALAGG